MNGARRVDLSLRQWQAGALLLASVFFLALFARALFAQGQPEVEVISEGGVATDNTAVPIDLTSYSAAKGALTASKMVLEFPGASSLANTPLTSIRTIVADDDAEAITMVGDLSFDGATVEAALVLDWPTEPGVEFAASLGLKAGTAGFDLTDLDSDFTLPGGGSVALGGAVGANDVSGLLVVSTAPQDVANIDGASSFYPDDITIGGGMFLAGTIDLTSLAPNVGQGVVASVSGEVGAGIDLINPTTSVNVDKLSLAGTVAASELNLPASIDSGVWTIGLEYSVADGELDVSGGANLVLSDPVLGGTDLELLATIQASSAGVFSVTAGLPADENGFVAPWSNVLGTSLTVEELTASFATGGGNSMVTISGAVTGGSASASIEVVATESSISASLDFARLSVASLVRDVGAAFAGAAVEVPPQLENLQFSADVDFSYDSTDDALAASALGTVGFGDSGAQANLLVLFSKVGNAAPVGLVSAQMNSIELGDVIPDMDASFAGITLPAVAIRANDAAVDTTLYDGQVQTYLQTHFCGDAQSTCVVPSGVALRGTFPAPESLRDPLQELWIDVDSPFVIEGTADVFEGSGSDFALSVQLPDMNAPVEQDWFESSSLQLAIASDGGSFSFSLTGSMTVRIPDESEPNDVDTVTFAINTELEISLGVPSVSLTVTGGLSGLWETPGGVDWLTFTQLKLELQVTVGAGKSSVVVGFRAGAQFCTSGALANCAPADTKDLDASLAVGVRTPVPGSPCNCAIDLGIRIASKAGVSLNDVVTIAEGAEGLQVPTAVKDSLPDVSLKNIELMISTIDSPELCLTEGIRISADLYIGAMDTTGAPNAEDLVDNCRTAEQQLEEGNARCENVDECYASVLFEISSAGIFVDASMSAIDLGPVSITGVDDAPGPQLRLVITESVQEFSISGGMTIDGFARAEGSMMVSSDGFALSIFVGEDGANPQNFFQVDASATIGTADDPDAIVFNLDVKLVLDIQDIVDAIYNDLFGWTGADYLEFRCLRLRVNNVTVNSGSVIPTTGTVSIGIHVMVSEEEGDPLVAKKLGVDWDFGESVGNNVTDLIGDVFGGFQAEGPGEGCGLGGYIQPNAFEAGSNPDNLVSRKLPGGGFDIAPPVFVAGQTASIRAITAWPEPGSTDLVSVLTNVYSVTVDWGDVSNGTPQTSETQTSNNFSNGLPRPSNNFAFDHVLTLPPGVQSETRTVTFTVTHARTGQVYQATSPITIVDGAPHSIGIDPPMQTGGNENYVQFSFTHRPPDESLNTNVLIDWGHLDSNGDPAQDLFSFANASSTEEFTATADHEYPEPGEYPVTVTFRTPSLDKSVVKKTTAIVENVAPGLGGFTSFKSRNPQTGVVSAIAKDGGGFFGYRALPIPAGHELLITSEWFDGNFPDTLTLTATLGPDIGVDIPLVATGNGGFEVVDHIVNLDAIRDQIDPTLTLVASDEHGGVSSTFYWTIAYSPDNGVQNEAREVSGEVDFTTTSNTYRSPIEPGEPNQADGRGGALWWRWTPGLDGTYTITDDGSTTVNGADQETIIRLYDSTGNTLLSSATQGGNGTTELVTPVVNTATDYLITVQAVQNSGDPGRDPNGSGPVRLSFALAGIPTNDNFADAEPLPETSGFGYPRYAVSGTTIAATAEDVEPSHAGTSAKTSVWYIWDSEFAGPFELSVSGSDPRVAVYSLANGFDPASFDYPEVASDDDDGFGFNSKVIIESKVQQYLIAVDAFSAATQSDFTLTIEPVGLTNDTEATADSLVAGEPTRGSNLKSDGATGELPVPPQSAQDPRHVVWYTWTVPYADDDWRFSFGKDPSIELEIYAINDDPARPFPCGVPLDNKIPGTCETFDDMDLNAGETLTIAIYGMTESDIGGFDLAVSSSNDFDDRGGFFWNFDGNEVNLGGQPIPGTFMNPLPMNNAGATSLEPGELAHGPFLARNTTWIVLRVPESGFYEFIAASNAAGPIDTVMALYRAKPDAGSVRYPLTDELELLATNDDYKGSSDSRILHQVSSDDFLHIMVDGYAGDTGVFDLSFEKVDVAHDDFDAALDFATLEVSPAGLPIFPAVPAATFEQGEPPHLGFSGVPSAWYQITADSGGSLEAAVLDPYNPLTTELPDDFGLAIYSGNSLDALVPLGGGFGGGTTTGDGADLPVFELDVVQGETIYFVAFGNTDVEWSIDFEGAPSQVPGDDIGATNVISGATTVTGTNVGATTEPNETAGSCFTDNPALQSSVWYRWRSSNDSDVTVDTNGSDFDTQLAIYEATPSGLSEVVCDDDDGAGLQSLATFTPVSGRYYYFQVDGYSAATGAIVLTVDQAPSEAFHALTNICTPLATGPLHAGTDLDGPPIPGWGDGTTDTITFSVVGDIPAEQYPFSPGRCEVPSTATAIFANVWVVNPANEGNMILSPAGVAPTGGVLNFGGDAFKNSNAFSIPISATGELDLKLNAGPLNGTSVKMVDSFILQVYGWYGPPETGNQHYSEALEYVPVTPCMFLETRPNREPSPAFEGPYAPNDIRDVKVAGTFAGQGKLGKPGSLVDNTTCGVPDGTSHVMVNTELVQTAGGAMGMQNLDNFFGFMAFNQPQNVPMNNASAVVVPLDAQGEMRFQMTGVGGATSNVRMSVLGYYQPIAQPGGFTFTPLTPCAVFDSRPNKGSTGEFAGIRIGGQTTRYEVRGTFDSAQGGGNTDCGIPFDAVAIDVSVEAVNAVREGNIVVSAAGAQASGGVLNFAQLTPKMNNANAVTVPISSSGEIDVFVNAGTFAVGQDTAFIRGVVTGYWTEG